MHPDLSATTTGHAYFLPGLVVLALLLLVLLVILLVVLLVIFSGSLCDQLLEGPLHKLVIWITFGLGMLVSISEGKTYTRIDTYVLEYSANHHQSMRSLHTFGQSGRLIVEDLVANISGRMH